MEVDGQRHAPAALPLENRTSTHGIGVWIGPWDDMGYYGNSRPPPPPPPPFFFFISS